jgi:hypothetical protein
MYIWCIICIVSFVCICSVRIISNPSSFINRGGFQQVANSRTAKTSTTGLFSSSPSNNVDLFSKQSEAVSTESNAEPVSVAASRQDDKQRKMMDEAVKLRRQAAELEVGLRHVTMCPPVWM